MLFHCMFHLFYVYHFKSHYLIFNKIASVFYVLGFFFWPQTVGSLFPDQGSKLHSLQKRRSLNHWTTREVPAFHLELPYHSLVEAPSRFVCLLPQSGVSCFFISSTSFYLEVKHFFGRKYFIGEVIYTFYFIILEGS